MSFVLLFQPSPKAKSPSARFGFSLNVFLAWFNLPDESYCLGGAGLTVRVIIYYLLEIALLSWIGDAPSAGSRAKPAPYSGLSWGGVAWPWFFRLPLLCTAVIWLISQGEVGRARASSAGSL